MRTLGPTPGASDLSRLEARIRDSLRMLKEGPSLEVMRELEQEARAIRDGLRRGTLVHERAARLYGRIKLLVKGMEES